MAITNQRWARGANDFAVRVDAQDLKGLFNRGVTIEPGTNALFIEGGRARGVAGPGYYTLSTLGRRLREWFTGGGPERATVLLVDVAPTDLEFNLGGIFTSDPLRIGLTIRLQVAVEDPAPFLINLMKGADQFTLADLQNYLRVEVVPLAENWIRGRTAEELLGDFEVRGRFELALEEALRRTFSQSGLKFLQVRALGFNLEHLDRITGKQSKVNVLDREREADLELARAELASALQAAETDAEAKLRLAEVQADYDNKKAAAELAAKQRFQQLQSELDLVRLADETRKVAYEEQMVGLYDRMRQAVLSDRMGEVKSEEDFARFLDDVDRGKLMREREKGELLRTWRDADEDHERARAYTLAKLDVERQFALQSIQLQQRQDLSSRQLDFEIDMTRKRLDADLGFRQRVALEEVKIEEEKQRIAQRRYEIQLEQQRLAFAQDIDEAKQGIELLRLMKETRRLDEEERLRIARQDRLETMKFEHELELEKMEAEARQRAQDQKHGLEVMDREHAFELDRIKSLESFGRAGALILANPEQARAIKEMAETEALSGMSAEAILARVAQGSPDAIKAIAEVQAGKDDASKKEFQAAYEQVVGLLKEQVTELKAGQREQIDREREHTQVQKEMYEKGMDTAAQIARDVTQNTGRDTSPPIIINTPGGGGPQVVSGGGGGHAGGMGGGGEKKSCPECGRQVDAADPACRYCGHTFKGV